MHNTLFSYRHVPLDIAKSMLIYVQSAGEFKCQDSYVVKRKKYESILLMIPLSGKGYLKYRNKSFEIDKNTGVIINCNEPHVYFTDKEDLWHFAWIHFYGAQSIPQVNFIINNNGPLFDLNSNFSVHENTKKIFQLLSTYNTITREIQISQLLYDSMSKLMQNSLLDEKRKDIPEIINKAINCIEQWYSKEFSLDDLAIALYINKYSLIRIFKSYLGVTPYEYLLNYRIQQARVLLETTQLNISEITNAVGFKDTSYFIKVFKKHMDCTPLKYKNNWGLA